ncbi:hypothetical protein LX36DRAFT_444310 [Colletotrichum falcatum]|nr:hypothetical protein LX36DRAFT_444310 [Colletotrichum falcatum]
MYVRTHKVPTYLGRQRNRSSMTSTLCFGEKTTMPFSSRRSRSSSPFFFFFFLYGQEPTIETSFEPLLLVAQTWRGMGPCAIHSGETNPIPTITLVVHPHSLTHSLAHSVRRRDQTPQPSQGDISISPKETRGPAVASICQTRTPGPLSTETLVPPTIPSTLDTD